MGYINRVEVKVEQLKKHEEVTNKSTTSVFF